MSEQKFEVRHIHYETLRNYWIEVDHFLVADKKYDEVLSHLGPYPCEFKDPRRFSYGLFDQERLIGVTHITQWSKDWVRCRTINVRDGYRDLGLSTYLFSTAIAMDWKNAKSLLGWIRDTAYGWALKHGFREIDGQWHGKHIAMLKDL